MHCIPCCTEWLLGDGALTLADGVSINGSRLIIAAAKHNHDNTYICSATNIKEQIEVTANISVFCKYCQEYRFLLSVHLHTLSVFLSVCLPICQSLCLSVRLSVCLCLSASMIVFLYVCLSVWQLLT